MLPSTVAPPHVRSRPRPPAQGELIGLALLGLALAFQALTLLPELHLGRVPPNDLLFHRAASERLGEAIGAGEPFLDPWVSEWSLGYPLWRSYQPLPHLLGAAVMTLAAPVAGHPASFAALHFLLMVLLPASVYVGARLLGLAPRAAGLAAMLALAPSGYGEPGRYGLGAGAFAWRGSGLYTQLVALLVLVPALGLVRRALDEHRGRSAAAALLAATTLCHIVFGYVAFVSAFVLAVLGPRGRRSERLGRLAVIVVAALALVAWFVVPMALVKSEINHSRWEKAFKWDSFGWRFILGEIKAGRLLDWDRPPVLTLLIAAAALIALLRVRRDPLAARLLGLTLMWLLLFFGREPWGQLLALAAVPKDLHLHRLQAAFELSAVLLAGFGIDAAFRALAGRRKLTLALALVAAAAVLFAAAERWRYLGTNAEWGEASLAQYESEAADVALAIADVRTILAERPGRVSAGLAATWGSRFKIGSVPFYSFLSAAHIDEASFLYHAMSRTSDVMVLRDESDPGHDIVFGIRAVVAPRGETVPASLRLRGEHGRIRVYESSGEGYFGLVDVVGRYRGPRAGAHDVSAAWLRGQHRLSGAVFALGELPRDVPTFAGLDDLPPVPEGARAPRGAILRESKIGETYAASLRLARPAWALVKITYFPGLRAEVDGVETPVVPVTPGFLAVSVPAGSHEVVVAYRPGPLKALLFLAGLLAFVPLLRVGDTLLQAATARRWSRVSR